MSINLKNKRVAKRALINTFYVVAGALALAMGVGMFLKPFNLVSGGVSGLSIALYNITGTWSFLVIKDHDYTMEFFTTVLTWVVFFIGWAFLGKRFALKTLASSACYTAFLPIVTTLTTEDWFFDGIFNLNKYKPAVTSVISGTTDSAAETIKDVVVTSGIANGEYAVAIIAAVFGGLLVGVGCALTFRGGGSTGGLDVFALIVAKYFKRAKSSVWVFIFDASVVIFGIYAVKNFIMSLLGITSAFVVAFVIDKVFIGEKKAFIANIVSEKHNQIRESIINKLDRTCTIIEAKGGFTDKKRPIIMVSFTMPEYAALLTLVDSIDKDAFITIHRAHEINGEGFTKYDVKKKDK